MPDYVVARRCSALRLLIFAAVLLGAFAATGPTSALATEAPVAAYSLDEGSGTVAHDLYGNHDGTLEKGATENALPDWTPGRFGSALHFEGKGYQCVNIPQSPDLELTEAFTIETWVKPEGTGSEEPLIFKEAPTFESHTAYALYLGFEGNGRVGGFLEEEGFEKQEVQSESLPVDRWTHLALSFDGEALRLYVNGELVDTTAAESAQESKGPLKFGCAEVYGQDFQGKLDEVRIYDRAISGDEVKRDQETALQTPPGSQQPVVEYSFDEGEGTVAYDLAGARDATIEGAEWARGKYGGGLEFDGEEDCVSIPAPGLRLREEFTLEAWVRPEGELKGDPVIFDEAEGFPAYGLGIGLGHGGKAEGVIGEEGEGTLHVNSAESLNDNAWTHLALSFDGARVRLYVDGVLGGTEAIEHPDFGSAGPLTIGCDALFNAHFKGRIDEVRLYNRALNGTEVANDSGTAIQTPAAGPVAAFAFEEGEGATAQDTTGNGHTATLEGATWARGRYGNGLSFDGEEDCVSIANSADLNFTEEFSLEAWVRPSGEGEEANPILAQLDPEAGEGEEPYVYELLVGGNEVPKGWVREAGSGFAGVYGTEPLPEEAWDHLALTDDGAHIRLYVNGELIRSEPAPPLTTGSGDLEIGCGAFATHFDGRIDELRLYDRALGSGEVAADMEAPIQAPKQGPVAAYSFDEGTGTTAADFTGDGHTATITGAEWARGRYGSGLQFDGEEDCVTIEATPDLQFTEEFSLEAWVRPEGAGEEALPVIEMADENSLGAEEEYAYELLAGQKELPKGWVRKGGASGFQGVYGEEVLPEHAWAHLALTDDGAHIRLYVNGVLVDTNTAPSLTTAEGPVEIGCEPYAHFKGRIDEVRLYNRALNGTEVAEDRDKSIDQEPPQIDLSGSLLEGLKEGTKTYGLEAKATDGTAVKPGVGVRRVEISVDGSVAVSKVSNCEVTGCVASLNWVYNTSEHPGEFHTIMVDAEDRLGHIAESQLTINPPNGDIPACSPDGTDPGSTPTEVIGLPNGGVENVYQGSEGSEFGFPKPPGGFDPLTASAAERREYGFPEEPSGPGELTAWTQAMRAYKDVPPENGCASAGSKYDQTETVRTNSTETSGYVALSANVTNWSAVSAIITQPEVKSCRNSSLSDWVALGGNQGGFFQAGTLPFENHINAFAEYIIAGPYNPKGDQPIHHPLNILPTDNVYTSVVWNAARERAETYVEDLRNGHSWPSHRKQKPGQDLYNGALASFIVESSHGGDGNPFGLRPFSSIAFSEAQAVQSAGGPPQPLGHLSNLNRRDMIRNGTLLAASSPLGPKGSGFVETWHNCRL